MPCCQSCTPTHARAHTSPLEIGSPYIKLPQLISLLRHLVAPKSTLFPYTTLFRSAAGSDPSWGAGIPFASAQNRDSKVRFWASRSEEHTSELQSRENLVCRLLLEKKKTRHLLCCESGKPTYASAHRTSLENGGPDI